MLKYVRCIFKFYILNSFFSVEQLHLEFYHHAAVNGAMRCNVVPLGDKLCHKFCGFIQLNMVTCATLNLSHVALFGLKKDNF